jgi:uncharacterized membrane protein YkoI
MRTVVEGAVLALALAGTLALGAAGAEPPPAGESLGAGWREQQNEARDTVRAGRHVPLERVIDEIRRRTPGRLLDTGLEQGPAGRPVYRVRWAAANGRRIDFLVDAGSGAILAAEGR